MAEPDYFKNALANFTFEAACGGAIRHLTDSGYSVTQIMERLQFPTSYNRVQKAVWERLLDTGVILLTQPGSGDVIPKAEFVKEYDKYGKASFRKVSVPAAPKETLCFIEIPFNPACHLASFLLEKCSQNGQDASYVSCDFGLEKGSLLANCLPLLDPKQQEYLTGLPWPAKLCYHRLNRQMLEIIVRLYENGKYQGNCYFLKTKEHITFFINNPLHRYQYDRTHRIL